MNHEPNYDLILGTAGHIDHGKTSLIKELTGIDTDRLPEEKKRGITIELGYAHLDLAPFHLGIVDVPGHEKFVRQMLAGATGMDLVMLVIAADDSIKQQTYEHLDILRLLNLPAGLIVLTKCDMCDPEWLDMVEMEVRQFVQGTFLEESPIVRTSVKSGLGIEALKEELRLACTKIIQTSSRSKDSDESRPFRMAIDRNFSIAGHGTIVTGSVTSGRIQVGDQVQVMPGNFVARVRGIQNHNSQGESARRGQRAAINLAGVALEDIDRGDELASPGYLVPSTIMTLKLSVLARASAPIKDRDGINFHLGTNELPGVIRLIGVEELNPGESGLAQILLREPMAATWNQPFVVRRPSPQETLGGGIVIHPNPERLRKPTGDESERLKDLTDPDELTRASAAIFFSNVDQWKPADLIRTAGVYDFDVIYRQLKDSGQLREVAISANRSIYIHQRRLTMLAEKVIKALVRLHRKHPLRFSHPKTALIAEFSYLNQPGVLDLAFAFLKDQKRIIVNVHSISLVGEGPKLSKGQKLLYDQLIETFQNKGVAPPMVDELRTLFPKGQDSISELLELSVENGELVKVSKELFLHRQTFLQIQDVLTSSLTANPGLSTSDLRQVLNTTRKYAIPILEYCDQIGFTSRQDDVRFLASSK